MKSHRLVPGTRYADGEHTWHYWSNSATTSYGIRVLRHDSTRTYNVCSMDTLSNPNAERDADIICAALNAAESN